MPTRKASAHWEGGLKDGKGSFKGASGAVGATFSFGTRFEETPGSNPEELLAAAHAGCFSMALSSNLEKNGTPPESVDTQAACTIEKVGEAFKITTMRLNVTVRAKGLDDAKLQELALKTKEGCPVSGAIQGNVNIVMEARLER
jgi:osmotically inducible protein OsmC